MIIDTLANFDNYVLIHPSFTAVAPMLEPDALKGLSSGTHERGERIKVIVNEYETVAAASKFIECHRRYIDLQIVLVGVELLGFCPRELCDISTAYNQTRDYEAVTGPLDFFTLRPGMFALCFPTDAHMPGVQTAHGSGRVKKAVFKIPVAASESDLFSDIS